MDARLKLDIQETYDQCNRKLDELIAFRRDNLNFVMERLTDFSLNNDYNFKGIKKKLAAYTKKLEDLKSLFNDEKWNLFERFKRLAQRQEQIKAITDSIQKINRLGVLFDLLEKQSVLEKELSTKTRETRVSMSVLWRELILDLDKVNRRF